MNDTVATESQGHPANVTSLKARRNDRDLGSRNSSGPAVIMPAPKGRTYDRCRPARSHYKKALANRGRPHMTMLGCLKIESACGEAHAVIPGWSEGPDLRCAIAHRGISRFRVRAMARPGMTVQFIGAGSHRGKAVQHQVAIGLAGVETRRGKIGAVGAVGIELRLQA